MTPRWPNVFVAGAHKAGTTSLWAFLGQHPEIRTSHVKEPHFFSRFDPEPMFRRLSDEAAYLQLFASGDEQFRVDASTSYLWDEAAAPAIARACPEARIVISLRDPVERAYSHYWYWVRYGLERRGFLEAVHVDVGGGANPYVDRGLYAAQVARYLDLFGERVFVLFFENLVKDPGRELAAVLRFLGLNGGWAECADVAPRNVAALPRNVVFGRLIGSSVARRLGRAVVPRSLRSRVERSLLRAAEKPPLDPRARDSLAEVYAPDAERLRTLLGRPLVWERERDSSQR